MNKLSALALVFSFLVDILLLLGTNRLFGYPPGLGRCSLGAAVGALFALGSTLPGLWFLGNVFWRTVMIVLISMVAFDIEKTTLYRGGIYWLLHMALEGITMDTQKLWIPVLAAVGICLMCTVGYYRGCGMQRYVPVELHYGGRQLKLTALRDTGNMLIDPVTGQSVLVVGADAAQTLIGLTREQLRQPVESIGAIPGLRLIPYKTIGQGSGFLLGLRMGNVQIGSRCGSRVVAFAPESLGTELTYQALTGGWG